MTTAMPRIAWRLPLLKSSALPEHRYGLRTSLAPRKVLITSLEPRAPYLDALEKLVDWKRLRHAKLRFVFDPMHGAAAGLLPELLGRNGIPCDEIRGTRDPRFGGVHPEPIEPH